VPLANGARLGPYQILGGVGAGGMGEVYRALDPRLGREVAIKVLPADRLSDPTRRARFEREARTVAALNHPHIVTIYEIESAEGVDFIVMEFVSGKTLDALIPRQGMRLGEALRVAIPLADALAAAHAAGIVHRDIKPSNVMVTPEGVVKVLDFGLAKLAQADEGRGEDTPTVDARVSPPSWVGTVAGTPAYMSPEQASGGKADARSDVFSYGAVLWEMVTGHRAFAGRSSAETLAAVLREQPRPPSELVPDLPRDLERIILRCLRKEPERRFQHMTDLKVELLEVRDESDSQAATPRPVARRRSRRGRLAWMAAGAAVLLAVALAGVLLQAHLRSPKDNAPSESVRTFAVELGGQLAFGVDYPASVVLSPKGDQIAFVAGSGGKRQIYVRPMAEMNARPLAGTEGAQQPFFSPDGRWLGFFAEGKLKKMPLGGGAPVVLSPAPYGMGGAWSTEGWIVYAASDFEGLHRVSENGGEGEVFSRVDLTAGEQGHWSPTLLADHRTVLFTVYTGGRNTESRLAVQGPGDRAHRVILQGGGPGRLLPPHWLIYGRGRELLAAPFDSVAGVVTGTPFRVLDGVQDTPSVGAPIFDVCDQGTLVYAPAATADYESRLVWLDQTGHVQGEIERSRVLGGPRLAPDGSRVAYHFADPDFDVWVKDLGRGTRLRLTQDPGWDAMPVWSPDGGRIVFSSAREGSRTLFLQSADGSGRVERLLEPGNPRWPTSWSPNGAWLAFHEEDPQTRMDIWLLDMASRRARPLRRTPYHEAWARFSPDGAWLAYQSNESGSFEVYVCRLDEPNRRLQISAGGGIVPIWSATGNTIYYTRGAQLMVVGVRLVGSPRIGRPHALFTTDNLGVNDVNVRGDRFLAVEGPVSTSISRFSLVEGWNHAVAGLAEKQ
jgi:serine/threonine protein kinase/Tol biopolymer transport system component